LRAQTLKSNAGTSAARETIGEIIQAWPSIISAPKWGDILPEGVSSSEAVDLAIERWQRGQTSPGPFANQAIALVALGQRWDLASEAVELSRLGQELADASLAVYGCHPAAGQMLDQTSDADRRAPEYWALVMIRAAQEGRSADDAFRLYRVMTGGRVSEESTTETLNPLHENNLSGFSADSWGYRRPPIFWPSIGVELPSPLAGTGRWLLKADETGEAGISC
jgi:hypothetical protein